MAEKPAYRIERPDLASVDQLREIADRMRGSSGRFAAGYTLTHCTEYAWGDIDAAVSCSMAALQEFEASINASDVDPLEQVASLWMCLVEIGMTGTWLDPAEVGSLYRALQSGLAYSLTK